MTPLEQRKLAMYRSALGPMTAEGALAAAIECESIANACGPFDPAGVRFSQDVQSYLTYAELIEKDRITDLP